MAGKRLGAVLTLTFVALNITTCLCCYKRLVYHGQFPLLYIDDCTSNYDLGLLVGSTFSSMIKGRLRESTAFQKVQAYCGTNWGRQLLAALKGLHRATYPTYFAELQGVAAGSGVPFDHIFMLNLRQEILAASESPDGGQRWLKSLAAARGGTGGRSDSGLEARDSEHLAATKGLRAAGGHSVIRSSRSGASALTSVAASLVDGAQAAASHAETDRMGSSEGAVLADAADGAQASGSGAMADEGTAAGGGDVVGEGMGPEGSGGTGDEPWVDPLNVDACSDVAVRLVEGDDPAASPYTLLVGHNEDMTNDTLGRMYYLRASMPGHAAWFALTYAGELASTAFGANTAGVAFTLNALYPTDAELPGLGRNFLSRRLLDARSTGEALEVLTAGGQATGRSVNLMSTREPLGVWNVEIGPGGSYDIRVLANNDWYFHANAYIRLPQRQKVDNSSLHRQARADQYSMPTTTTEVLDLLGDTADPEFPIYRTGDYGGLVYTLCTALYDLTARTMTVYRGNPRLGLVGSVLSLESLLPRAGLMDGDEEGALRG